MINDSPYRSEPKPQRWVVKGYSIRSCIKYCIASELFSRDEAFEVLKQAVRSGEFVNLVIVDENQT